MKKKFVKAMLLGAMVFAVGTAVTSCKDYDDDINSLQEQIASINKIGADVTTADMNAAINSAVSGLQSKLDDLAGKVASAKDVEALQTAVKELKAAVAKGATKEELSQLTTKLNDEVAKLNASIEKNVGAAKEELQGKIDQLEKDMQKADKDAAEKMTKELADLKSEMQELINANAKSIADLTSKIADYENIQNAIAEYEKAKGTYLTSKDIEGFLKEDAVKDIVDARVVEALKSTTGASAAIQKYVEDAISTFYSTQIKNVYLTTDAYNAAMVELDKKIEKMVSSEDAEYQKIFTSLNKLEEYKLSAWEEVINSLGEKNTIEKVEKLTAAMGEITNLQEELSGYVKTETLDNYLKTVDLKAEIDKYLADKENAFVKELDDLKTQFAASQKKIQSVSFVQTNVDRTVTFDTWYALKETVSANTRLNAESWKNISGDSKQKVTFRVSPASAAADFAANYDVTFSADAEISRAAKTDAFEVIGEPVVEDGFVTYTIKSKASKSYAVCMHVTTKEDKVATLGQSDITSDYFAAMVENRFIYGVQRVADPAVNKEICFEHEGESVNYTEVGEYILNLCDVKGNSRPSERLSKSTFDASLLTTKYSIDENDFFNINNGVVSLKEYGRPSYKDQQIAVKANVEIAGSANLNGYTVLGTVTAINAVKKAVVIYNKPIELTWSKGDQYIDAENFPLSTIYNHTNVRLTKREFEALHAKPIDDAKAKFEVGDQNVLTAVVNGETPAGTYTISVVFVDGEGEREITVKATVIVKNPTIAGLKTNPTLWAGSETAGQVGMTPTLTPDDKKPEDITLDLDLRTLFSNYAEIEEAVAKIPGANLNLIVVDQKGNKVTTESHYSTAGVAFNGVNLRLYKETFDVAKTQLSIKATVTLDGTQKPLQEFKAALSINNISGKWIAGDKALELKLDNKAISYEVGKKFQWVDSRNKVMWANGKTNAYDENFGDDALNLYGLEAPEFSFCNAKGEVVANDTYLTLDSATGELNFTEDGKVYKFQQDYVTYIKISAKSRWGAIANYNGNHIVTVTIPAEK